MVNNLVGGWPTPLKNDGVKVSWDDDIPNWMEKKHVPNHQPENNDTRPLESRIHLVRGHFKLQRLQKLWK